MKTTKKITRTTAIFLAIIAVLSCTSVYAWTQLQQQNQLQFRLRAYGELTLYSDASLTTVITPSTDISSLLTSTEFNEGESQTISIWIKNSGNDAMNVQWNLETNGWQLASTGQYENAYVYNTDEWELSGQHYLVDSMVNWAPTHNLVSESTNHLLASGENFEAQFTITEINAIVDSLTSVSINILGSDVV